MSRKEDTPMEATPAYPYLLKSGAHGNDSGDCCLLEACSLPGWVPPEPR